MAHPAFYFDLASPEAYLAAERVLQVMPVATEWIPVLARDLPAPESFAAWRCERERLASLEDFERRGAAAGLQAFRWPEPFPFDSDLAMRAATYAKQVGRTVAFTLAAFRQAYAGGRALSEQDNVVIAGSGCEMHPTALLKACGLKGTRAALTDATALAARRGVRDVPAVWVPGPGGEGDMVFHGDRELERAAAAIAARTLPARAAPTASSSRAAAARRHGWRRRTASTRSRS